MMIAHAHPVNSTLSVLIVDDNPSHLQIYGWLVEKAGYTALLAPVAFDGIQLPDQPSDLVLLDYHLGGQITAAEVARSIALNRPDVPLIVLSDSYELPADIAPYVKGFVRKGNPEKLIATLHEFLDSHP